jgi:hypothetical protein
VWLIKPILTGLHGRALSALKLDHNDFVSDLLGSLHVVASDISLPSAMT